MFEPKNKYIEPVVDTDVSNDTDVGGNSTVYSKMQFLNEHNMVVMRKDEENNMDSTDMDIVDQSFNMRPNDSFQIGNTETVDVTSVLNQLEMETDQNFIVDNDHDLGDDGRGGPRSLRVKSRETFKCRIGYWS